MKVEKQNAAVLEYLKGSNSLLDSKLVSLQIAEFDAGLTARLDFRARSGASISRFELKFSGELECGFYFSPEFVFYNVEQVKLEATLDGFFYLSLDPDMTVEGASRSDQDFVKARNVSLTAADED